MKIELKIEGLGHVPSFKNNKRAILDSATGRMRTMTDAKTQAWMKRAILALESQLRSALATDATAMATGPIPLSRIVSSLPLDDCLAWIPVHCVSVRTVSKGEEGAEILVEAYE